MRDYSNGLANSSGVLGHYYTDSLKGGGAEATVPDPLNPPDVRRPPSQRHLHHRFSESARRRRNRRVPARVWISGGQRNGFSRDAPGFGDAYKKAARAGETFHFLGYGEPLPRFENYVEFDPHVVDAFGIPVLRMHVAWGDNERNMVKDAGEQAAEMLEAAGMKNIKVHSEIHLPGDANHDVGTARMGSDGRHRFSTNFNKRMMSRICS